MVVSDKDRNFLNLARSRSSYFSVLEGDTVFDLVDKNQWKKDWTVAKIR